MKDKDRETFILLRKIILIVSSINASFYIVNGVMEFLYTDGLGGLVAPFIYFAIAALFLFAAISLNIKSKNIFIIILVIINIFAPFHNINMLKINIDNRNKVVTLRFIKNNNPSYQDCLNLPDPSFLGRCGDSLLKKNNDLLGCLNLSRESYLRYPYIFKEPGFNCMFGSSAGYLGMHMYNSTVLDDEEELAKILDFFEKYNTDYYKREDKNKYSEAQTYDDCLLIAQAHQALYCGDKILKETKDQDGYKDFEKKLLEVFTKYNKSRIIW